MSTLGAALSTAGGVVLIAITLRDVFDALFHPEGRATLSRGVMRSVWRLFRRAANLRPGLFQLAGPAALVTVVAIWAALLVLGWALFLWPHLPGGFMETAGGRLGGSFFEAIHLSLVTLTTLGFGDVVPNATWLRVVEPLEALLGFGLLSASISWLLLLYPVLLRRRALAYELTLLAESATDVPELVEQLGPDSLERLCAELTSRLVAVERDLVAFPVAYYFAERDPRFSLADTVPLLLELAENAGRREMPGSLRLRAQMLSRALDDFAGTVADRFHGHRSDSTPELLEAFAEDNLRPATTDPP